MYGSFCESYKQNRQAYRLAVYTFYKHYTANYILPVNLRFTYATTPHGASISAAVLVSILVLSILL